MSRPRTQGRRRGTGWSGLVRITEEERWYTGRSKMPGDLERAFMRKYPNRALSEQLGPAIEEGE